MAEGSPHPPIRATDGAEFDAAQDVQEHEIYSTLDGSMAIDHSRDTLSSDTPALIPSTTNAFHQGYSPDNSFLDDPEYHYRHGIDNDDIDFDYDLDHYNDDDDDDAMQRSQNTLSRAKSQPQLRRGSSMSFRDNDDAASIRSPSANRRSGAPVPIDERPRWVSSWSTATKPTRPLSTTNYYVSKILPNYVSIYQTPYSSNYNGSTKAPPSPPLSPKSAIRTVQKRQSYPNVKSLKADDTAVGVARGKGSNTSTTAEVKARATINSSVTTPRRKSTLVEQTSSSPLSPPPQRAKSALGGSTLNTNTSSATRGRSDVVSGKPGKPPVPRVQQRSSTINTNGSGTTTRPSNRTNTRASNTAQQKKLAQKVGQNDSSDGDTTTNFTDASVALSTNTATDVASSTTTEATAIASPSLSADETEKAQPSTVAQTSTTPFGDSPTQNTSTSSSSSARSRRSTSDSDSGSSDNTDADETKLNANKVQVRESTLIATPTPVIKTQKEVTTAVRSLFAATMTPTAAFTPSASKDKKISSRSSVRSGRSSIFAADLEASGTYTSSSNTATVAAVTATSVNVVHAEVFKSDAASIFDDSATIHQGDQGGSTENFSDTASIYAASIVSRTASSQGTAQEAFMKIMKQQQQQQQPKPKPASRGFFASVLAPRPKSMISINTDDHETAAATASATGVNAESRRSSTVGSTLFSVDENSVSPTSPTTMTSGIAATAAPGTGISTIAATNSAPKNIFRDLFRFGSKSSLVPNATTTPVAAPVVAPVADKTFTATTVAPMAVTTTLSTTTTAASSFSPVFSPTKGLAPKLAPAIASVSVVAPSVAAVNTTAVSVGGDDKQ